MSFEKKKTLHVLALDQVPYDVPSLFSIAPQFRRIWQGFDSHESKEIPVDSWSWDSPRGYFCEFSFCLPQTRVLFTFLPMTQLRPTFWIPFLRSRPPVEACWMFCDDRCELDSLLPLLGQMESSFETLFKSKPIPLVLQVLRCGFLDSSSPVELALSPEPPALSPAFGLQETEAYLHDLSSFFFPFRCVLWDSSLLRASAAYSSLEPILLWLFSYASR